MEKLVENTIRELEELESIKDVYYDALSKLDEIGEIWLEDYIHQLMYFDRDNVIMVTKLINKQANFVLECEKDLSQYVSLLNEVQSDLRMVVNYLRQKLVSFHGLKSVKYTKDLKLKFEF